MFLSTTRKGALSACRANGDGHAWQAMPLTAWFKANGTEVTLGSTRSRWETETMSGFRLGEVPAKSEAAGQQAL